MKKYLVLFLILGMFAVAVPSVKAYSVGDLYAQIKSLQKQVTGLQDQLSGSALSASRVATGAEVAPATITPTAPMAEVAPTQTTITKVDSSVLKQAPCTSTTTPWIKVVSPNGGENFSVGNIPVTWTSCNVPANTHVNVRVTYEGTLGSLDPFVSLNTGSAIFPLTSTMVTNSGWKYKNYYKISLRATIAGSGFVVADTSDNYFNILNSTPTTTPTKYLVNYERKEALFNSTTSGGKKIGEINCGTKKVLSGGWYLQTSLGTATIRPLVQFNGPVNDSTWSITVLDPSNTIDIVNSKIYGVCAQEI